MMKLTNNEAQRVINCLDDVLARLKVVSYVPAGNPDLDMVVALENDGGAEATVAALQQQWQAEENYLLARAQLASLASHGRHHHHHHGHGHHAAPQVNPEVVSAVHTSVRALCRELRRNPVACERVTGSGSHELRAPESAFGSPEFAALTQALADLTKVAFQKLATTVEEEATSKALMHELVERERGAEDERNALSATLALQRAERAKEAEAVDELEEKLRTELAVVEASTEAAKAAVAEESVEARQEAEDAHSGSSGELTAKVDKLVAALAEAGEKHREIELKLRKKKDNAEQKLAAKVAEYDAAMFAKADEVRDLKALMAEEKAQLDALEEHFAKVDANRAQQAEEERVLLEFRQKVADARGVLDKAATRVQKVARGRAARTLLKAATKGKKGKAGKKKK